MRSSDVIAEVQGHFLAMSKDENAELVSDHEAIGLVVTAEQDFVHVLRTTNNKPAIRAAAAHLAAAAMKVMEDRT